MPLKLPSDLQSRKVWKTCFLLHAPTETELPLQPVPVYDKHIHICTKGHFPAQPWFSQLSRNLTEGAGLQLYAWSTLVLHLHSSVLYFLGDFCYVVGRLEYAAPFSSIPCVPRSTPHCFIFQLTYLWTVSILCLISLDAVVEKLHHHI